MTAPCELIAWEGDAGLPAQADRTRSYTKHRIYQGRSKDLAETSPLIYLFFQRERAKGPKCLKTTEELAKKQREGFQKKENLGRKRRTKVVATGGEEMVCVVRRAGKGQPGGEANEIPGGTEPERGTRRAERGWRKDHRESHSGVMRKVY